MHRVEVDGIQVAFQRVGDGQPLLLLHGAASDSRVWRVQLEEMADEFTVVAWDAPGCGESSDPPETFRLPDYARCLSGLIDALDIEQPHLVGHSWGSGLALELYRQRPDVPRSLILVGGYAGWAGSLPADEVARRLQFGLQAAELARGAFDPKSMPGLFSDAMPAEMVDELVQIMSEIRPVGTRAMTHAFAEADLRDVLGDIQVPVLVLHGEDDERSSVDVADALHTAIPMSTLVVVAGLGHLLHLESAETFDAEVRAFILSIA